VAGPVPAAEPRRLGDRILKAGVIVLGAHLFIRLSGFVLLYWVANKYPNALVVSDVYNVIWDAVLTTAFLIGEQCLGPAFLPIFTRAWKEEGESRAWQYTSILFNTQALLLILVIGAMLFFPKQIVNTFTQWNSREVELRIGDKRYKAEAIDAEPVGRMYRLINTDSPNRMTIVTPEVVSNAAEVEKELAGRVDRRDLAYSMLPLAALGLLGMSLSTLTSMLLNGYKEFFWAVGGDVVLKVAILVGALAGTIVGKGDWHYIAIGIVIGGTLALLTHLAALGVKRLRQYKFSLNWSDTYFRAFILLILPLILGIIVSRARDNVITYVLTSQANLPTLYKFGKSITGGVNSLIPYALSIALLPYFCDISVRDDNKHLGELLTTIVRMLVWFFVPLSIVLAVAALPVCMVLFAGKTIQVSEAGLSAVVVQIFSLEMPFAAIEMMIMQAFFSSRRMIAPTIAGLVFSGLSALSAYVLVKVLNMSDPVEVLLTVSLCLVAARVLKVLVLIGLLRLTVPVLPWAQTAGFVARTAFAGIVTGFAAFGAARLFRTFLLERVFHQGRTGYIAEAIAIGLAGGIVYLALSLLLKMEEPRECWQWAKEKLRGRKSAAHNLPT
jgi:peptidoglycan biosynthesis protein MviN/MurJ (putative lipid II flippase)